MCVCVYVCVHVFMCVRVIPQTTRRPHTQGTQGARSHLKAHVVQVPVHVRSPQIFPVFKHRAACAHVQTRRTEDTRAAPAAAHLWLSLFTARSRDRVLTKTWLWWPRVGHNAPPDPTNDVYSLLLRTILSKY